MALLKCIGTDRTTDDGRPCTLLTAEVVRPGEAADGYVAVRRWELPDGYVPSGPLDLTAHPGGAGPALTAQHYSIAEMFHGPVLFFLKVYDPAFDGSPFVGRVFAAEGRGGEDGLELLFRDSGSDEGRPPPHPIPSHAHRIPLTELGLSGGLLRCLEAEGITTAANLCIRDAAELLEIRGLGSKRLGEVRQRLAALGLWLYGEQEAEGQQGRPNHPLQQTGGA